MAFGYLQKEGTQKIYTYQKESVMKTGPLLKDCDPRLNELVMALIGRVADKWTMAVLEVLAEHGVMRFTRIADAVPGVSQKMLTQTLRLMERDGLVTRTVHPVVPPRVEYALTDLGAGLGGAFCGVWTWAEENVARIEAAQQAFDARP
jgi:DNA-binding HxlR family transcriptional regulator